MAKKNTRPDHDGPDRGIFAHNKTILRKTATICALCGLPLDKSLKYPDPMSVSIDHIIPISLGGKSTLDNLQAAHLICNKSKGQKILVNPNTQGTTPGTGENNQNKNLYVANPTKDVSSIPQSIDWRNYSC